MNIFLLQAAQAAPQGGLSSWSSLIFFAVIILIFWLFFIRPQSKRQKKLQQERDALAVGDAVITAGGVHGEIRKVNEQTFEVEIARDVCIEIAKSSVYPLGTDPNAR
ncbi:MAG: preprotein translocase subunit YajC [Porphyromonas sp.]|uniref:preprotein translocase subunit YajC n=1 Tax=Porphyromonas sp. TaxID=1924944 RepID=UPI002A7531D4|nr:preprotein translocase subunit YajC [Porphyromonas sp.]MDY3111677.1 preprotein translocase subunit YajC [Porphyromonas sp.]